MAAMMAPMIPRLPILRPGQDADTNNHTPNIGPTKSLATDTPRQTCKGEAGEDVAEILDPGHG